jgi:hypothetical protein
MFFFACVPTKLTFLKYFFLLLAQFFFTLCCFVDLDVCFLFVFVFFMLHSTNRPMVWLVKQNTWPDPFRVLLPINLCSSKRTPIKRIFGALKSKSKPTRKKNISLMSHSTFFYIEFFCTLFLFQKKLFCCKFEYY